MKLQCDNQMTMKNFSNRCRSGIISARSDRWRISAERLQEDILKNNDFFPASQLKKTAMVSQLKLIQKQNNQQKCFLEHVVAFKNSEIENTYSSKVDKFVEQEKPRG